MPGHVVTAHGGAVAYPRIVATERAQHRMLVELALFEPPRSGGPSRTHRQAYFYVSDGPVGLTAGSGAQRVWLQVGHFDGFAGVVFIDDSVEEGADWAWVALRNQPMTEPPVVYFDQPSRSAFPPDAVMSRDELGELVLEFIGSGARPTSVRWRPINSLSWGEGG